MGRTVEVTVGDSIGDRLKQAEELVESVVHDLANGQVVTQRPVNPRTQRRTADSLVSVVSRIHAARLSLNV